MSALFGGRVYFYFKRGPDKNKAVHAWRVYGERAVGLMFTVYTFMSPKRRRQITRALEQWRAAPGKGWHGPLCRNGHERALYSYRIPAVSGKRHCRMCERASSLRVTARRRAARAA